MEAQILFGRQPTPDTMRTRRRLIAERREMARGVENGGRCTLHPNPETLNPLGLNRILLGLRDP